MSKEPPIEDQIEKHSIKIDQLALHLENVEREITTFFTECQIDLHKLATFVEDPNNFSVESWEKMTEQRKEFEIKLKRELAAVRNPKKAKQTYASLNVQRHWLHVR